MGSGLKRRVDFLPSSCLSLLISQVYSFFLLKTHYENTHTCASEVERRISKAALPLILLPPVIFLRLVRCGSPVPGCSLFYASLLLKAGRMKHESVYDFPPESTADGTRRCCFFILLLCVAYTCACGCTRECVCVCADSDSKQQEAAQRRCAAFLNQYTTQIATAGQVCSTPSAGAVFSEMLWTVSHFKCQTCTRTKPHLIHFNLKYPPSPFVAFTFESEQEIA